MVYAYFLGCQFSIIMKDAWRSRQMGDSGYTYIYTIHIYDVCLFADFRILVYVDFHHSAVTSIFSHSNK
jgi:hypothetical protein